MPCQMFARPQSPIRGGTALGDFAHEIFVHDPRTVFTLWLVLLCVAQHPQTPGSERVVIRLGVHTAMATLAQECRRHYALTTCPTLQFPVHLLCMIPKIGSVSKPFAVYHLPPGKTPQCISRGSQAKRRTRLLQQRISRNAEMLMQRTRHRHGTNGRQNTPKAAPLEKNHPELTRISQTPLKIPIICAIINT